MKKRRKGTRDHHKKIKRRSVFSVFLLFTFERDPPGRTPDRTRAHAHRETERERERKREKERERERKREKRERFKNFFVKIEAAHDFFHLHRHKFI